MKWKTKTNGRINEQTNTETDKTFRLQQHCTTSWQNQIDLLVIAGNKNDLKDNLECEEKT